MMGLREQIGFPSVIGGIYLEPLTFGHWLILLEMESSLTLTGSGEPAPEKIEKEFVGTIALLSQPYNVAMDAIYGPDPDLYKRLTRKVGKILRKRLNNRDALRDGFGRLIEYFVRNESTPRFEAVPQTGSSSEIIPDMIASAWQSFGIPYAEALKSPLNLIAMGHAYTLERRGVVRLVSDEESAEISGQIDDFYERHGEKAHANE